MTILQAPPLNMPLWRHAVSASRQEFMSANISLGACLTFTHIRALMPADSLDKHEMPGSVFMIWVTRLCAEQSTEVAREIPKLVPKSVSWFARWFLEWKRSEVLATRGGPLSSSYEYEESCTLGGYIPSAVTSHNPVSPSLRSPYCPSLCLPFGGGHVAAVGGGGHQAAMVSTPDISRYRLQILNLWPISRTFFLPFAGMKHLRGY